MNASWVQGEAARVLGECKLGFKECARRVLGDFKEGAWCLQVGFKEQGSRRQFKELGVCKLGSRSKVQGGC